MDNRPIGVFDSGLGGLTAVKELEQALPEESLVYFGDTGRVPYGSRSREILRAYAAQDMSFLLSSTAADIGASLPVPYFDVVSPTAKAAAAATRNGKIGVIGTNATIHSDSYRRALLSEKYDLEVFSSPCSLFVPLVENAFDSPQADPIIAPIISSVMGRGVTLIDSGREAALALSRALREQELLCDGSEPRTVSYFVTDTPENFAAVAELFLGHRVNEQTERINIENY